MNAEHFSIDKLFAMAHSPVRNYAIPGLTRWLIGERGGDKGTVRLFQCERQHQEPITPHSHRFSFQAWVLSGFVINRVWTKSSSEGDMFMMSRQRCDGMGKYTLEDLEVGRYRATDRTYGVGQCYSMQAEEIHSIFFSRDALVLFFEGSTEMDCSYVLQPYVNNEVIPTLETKPWMFQRDPKEHVA